MQGAQQCTCVIIPEVAGAEDDPPLHEHGGEELDDLTRTEGREQQREVNVLQSRVQRSGQRDCLHPMSSFGLEWRQRRAQ